MIQLQYHKDNALRSTSTMLLQRLVVARRKIYIYLLVVVCLLALNFKVSQDLITSRRDSFFGCLDCGGVAGNQDKDRNVNFFSVHYSIGSGNNTRVPPPRLSSKYSSLKKFITDTKDKRSQDKYLHQSTPATNDVGADSVVFSSTSVADVVNQDRRVRSENAKTSKHFISKNKRAFAPPRNERPARRYPQCVIIGFAKCGTRALLEFLSLHPYLVTHDAEMHFYDVDENFNKGFEWYRMQMPRSYSNQITIEKTPAYILFQRARDEIFKLTPEVKLIVLVRDPVIRLVSHFLLKYRNVLAFRDIPVEAIYQGASRGQFDPDYKPVVSGIYHRHLAMWLERFPRHQFLILNSEELTTDPLPVLRQVEAFLDIPPMFEERNFFYNETSGFFCPRGFEADAVPQCLGKFKGVKHPKLPQADKKMLYNFYQPLNEKFFRLVNQRFEWKEREWDRHK